MKVLIFTFVSFLLGVVRVLLCSYIMIVFHKINQLLVVLSDVPV